MEAPTVLTFIVRFMSDDRFRFDILQAGASRMAEHGLTRRQISILLSLEPTSIADLLLAEAAAAGADVARTRAIMDGIEACDPLPGAPLRPVEGVPQLASAAMYDQGKIHIHCVDADFSDVTGVRLWLRGHGFGRTPEFEFRLVRSSARTMGTIISPAAAGDDLFQRVRVRAPLTAGTWGIYARNGSDESFDEMTGDPKQSVVVS